MNKLLFAPLLMLLLTLGLDAQNITAALSSSFSYPGSVVDLTLFFTDSTSSANITGFQWTVVLPQGSTLGTPVVGSAAPSGTTITCAASTDICIEINPNGPPVAYGSGQIVIIPITLSAGVTPGIVQITLSSLIATSASGTNAPITFTSNATTVNLPLTINPTTGPHTWFTATSGSATCKFTKVAQTPIKITYVCTDIYGAFDGSYTVDPTFGVNGASAFSVSLTGMTGALFPTSTQIVNCNIQVNSTPQALLIAGASVTLPPQSAAYSCTGLAISGEIGWP